MKTLLALCMAMFVLVHAHTSEAGCAITVIFKNELNRPVTIQQLDSKTLPVGAYKKVWSGNLSVPAGGQRSVAVQLKLGCGFSGGTRMLRAKYLHGDNSGWKTKGPINTAVKRRFTMTFK